MTRSGRPGAPGWRRGWPYRGVSLSLAVLALGLLAGCAADAPASFPNAHRGPTPTACACPCPPANGSPTPTATPPVGTPCPLCSPTPTATSGPLCTPVPHPPPTATSGGSEPPPPTLPPHTPLPVIIGGINPSVVGALEGDALPGAVAADPRTGYPAVIWSQLNPDPGQETAARIYLQLSDPHTGTWLPARTVQPPGWYKIGKSAPESAVGLSQDGTIYVAYVRAAPGTAWIEWRASPDTGRTWSTPVTLAYPSSNQEIYNLRLQMDAAGQPHLVALVVPAGCDPARPCGDLVYYERLPNGTWRQERRPVSAHGARQYAVAVTTFPLADGRIRTVLGFNEADAIFMTYKDGPAGAWSRPVLVIDGQTHPYGIPDYEPGFGNTLRLLPFTAGGRPWVYAFWSLYSTGRICYAYSADGGEHWSGEDALAFEPLGPARRAHVSEPIPFWDPGAERLFVVYRFCAIGGAGGCYPVYAYGRPGEQGATWGGAEDPQHDPLRLFAPTQASQAADLRGTEPGPRAGGAVWLLWREDTGARELYRALLTPATLLSGAGLP